MNSSVPDLVRPPVGSAYEDLGEYHESVVPNVKRDVVAVVYAMVEAISNASTSPGTINVCLITDDRGTLISLEPSGIELTDTQAVELAQALAMTAAELQAVETERSK